MRKVVGEFVWKMMVRKVDILDSKQKIGYDFVTGLDVVVVVVGKLRDNDDGGLEAKIESEVETGEEFSFPSSWQVHLSLSPTSICGGQVV